jgi:hypothetical protein
VCAHDDDDDDDDDVDDDDCHGLMGGYACQDRMVW